MFLKKSLCVILFSLTAGISAGNACCINGSNVVNNGNGSNIVYPEQPRQQRYLEPNRVLVRQQGFDDFDLADLARQQNLGRMISQREQRNISINVQREVANYQFARLYEPAHQQRRQQNSR